MKIFVDADACPRPVKELLYRAADRRDIEITFVANKYLNLPRSANLRFIQVRQGFDVADHKIIELLEAGDLVITADIPLADEAVKAGALALDPRGELYTSENIGAIRAHRDFMATMRDSGVELSGGPSAYAPQDKQRFANALDRLLTRHHRPLED
ncbi:MAG: YaiI/YqxD family protein [Candidatus Dadabacteria bacterium]|nr:MAG: YaiI/YqxD family protein [Candidatus Dadabacteria bacterium]